ncbi:BTB/POZ and MATH domain-containing protein 5, partial [Dichanthelium oligosanthes]
MPTLPSTAGGVSAPTRSAIIAGVVTGYHLMDIEGYSRTTELLLNGEYTNSLPFTVGGRSWHLSYYPNGRSPASANLISIYLGLDDKNGAEPVAARAKFSLLDRSGKPVPSHTRTTGRHEYSADGYGYAEFIKRAYLESSEHLMDDCFTIRCDVTVSRKLCKKLRRAASPSVDVPPSDLHCHFGELLSSNEGADVTFRVAGETFKAH